MVLLADLKHFPVAQQECNYKYIIMNTGDLQTTANPYKSENNMQAMPRLGDTRKPKITLQSLNKLRKMRELRKLEKLRADDFVEIMYGAPPPEAGA